jgi:flagellar basal body-associated protein FliL
MSDEEDNEEGSAPEPKAPKKSRLGLVLATVVVVVLVTGAAVAGTMFGPALIGRGKKADAAAEKEKEKEKEKPIGETVELTPILVDARAKNGELHHLKVVLAIEVAEGTTKEEFMKYSPRGREAAVGYLRSLTFEEQAEPERFNDVRLELSKRFSEAVGEKKIARVMVIDFVAQ